MRYRPDLLPREGVYVDSGEITVTQRDGDERNFAAPVEASYSAGAVHVRRDAAEVALLPRQTVAWVDVTAPSPERTAALITGVCLGGTAVIGFGVWFLGQVFRWVALSALAAA